MARRHPPCFREEWALEDDHILVFSNAKLQAAHRERMVHPVRRHLHGIVIPNIILDGIDAPTAFQQVRLEAARIAGLSGLPKIELPKPLSQPTELHLKVTNASVLTLFSVSRRRWLPLE